MNPENSHPPGAQPEPQLSGGRQDSPAQQNSPKKPRFWQGWTPLEWTQIVFDALLFVATTAYAVFALLQFQALNATLTETKNIAVATNSQASAAAESAKAAQDANALTREAQKQAQDLVADADRPWVGVQHIGLIDYAVGKKAGAVLQIINVGKTPALHLVPTMSIDIVQGIPVAPPDKTFPSSYRSRPVLFPNQSMASTPILFRGLSADEFDSLAGGKSSLMAWGTLTYTDRAQRPLKTDVCIIFNTTLHPTNFGFCTEGNDAY